MDEKENLASNASSSGALWIALICGLLASCGCATGRIQQSAARSSLNRQPGDSVRVARDTQQISRVGNVSAARAKAIPDGRMPRASDVGANAREPRTSNLPQSRSVILASGVESSARDEASDSSSPIEPGEPEPLLPPIEDLPAPDANAFRGQPSWDQFPIDLPAALQLAGANNLQIALAVERVRQARARLMAADVLWFPSLDAGVGYNIHKGQIQDTRGDILDVRRSSAFVGGGPVIGANPLNGGTNGPSRLALGLPLTDAIFAPLAERQRVRAANASQAATFNDELLAVANSYLELVRAEGQVAIAGEAVANANELVRLVEARVKAGTAPPADELRAQAELADRERKVFKAEEAVRDVSAELVRLLHLPPGLTLLPNEAQPVAIDLVNTDRPLPDFIAQGLTFRPELAAHQAMVRATLDRLRQEKWRPLIPNVGVGLNAGGFGGGRDGFFGDFSGRTDFDALAVWELRGMGYGNAALIRERRSEHLQAHLSAVQVRDTVAAEVTSSYYQARLRKDQIEAAHKQLDAAGEALPLNFKGILGGQLRAIEALQAIDALTAAQTQYLTSVIDYNRAQFQLLRALGIPPDVPTDHTL